ncbi:hypothetical protein GPK34_00890 [Secundilactobacillus kimchicus]|uniref:hypothetical protein n=1 Tax=Secundilactobacillus kimchicus TaxID=528209 RepID=UPI001C01AC80|nr:hypothetical protein [Secundilactobacillus kimchicus]MBT9670595.1 hypothetical protein [Secundilactobacillus kimchicus]
MSLTDQLKSIKNEVESPANATKLNEETKKDLNLVMRQLSKRIVEAVDEGEVKIRDTRDIKDVVAMYQMLNQQENAGQEAPAITANVANFYSQELGVKEGTKAIPKQVEKTVEDMSAEEIAELSRKQQDTLEKDNQETFGG